jgi:hypothetical protein
MFTKLAGALLLAAGLITGLVVLVALVGTAIGLLWMVIKLVVPIALIYAGYRLFLAGDRPQYV